MKGCDDMQAYGYNSDGVFILDQNFNKLVYIDNYSSLIWVEKYLDCGEFELYLKADPELLPYLQIDNLVVRDYIVPPRDIILGGRYYYYAYPEYMIIEKVQVTTDADQGNYFIVSGRTWESVLGRRVLHDNHYFGIYPLSHVQYICNQDSTLQDHPLPWTSGSTTSANINESEQVVQVNEPTRGMNLLDFIQTACRKGGYGFRLLKDVSYMPLETYKYFYKGQDRTRNQSAFSPVIFSPEYHNLTSSSYEFDTTSLKNACLTVSDGEWYEEKNAIAYYNDVEESGLEYREMFLKSSVPLKDDQGNARSEGTILSELDNQGGLELLNHRVNESLNFNIISTDQFIYLRDYFLGDLVTVDNGFGISAVAMVTEVSQVWDENGYQIVPKLDIQ